MNTDYSIGYILHSLLASRALLRGYMSRIEDEKAIKEARRLLVDLRLLIQAIDALINQHHDRVPTNDLAGFIESGPGQRRVRSEIDRFGDAFSNEEEES